MYAADAAAKASSSAPPVQIGPVTVSAQVTVTFAYDDERAQGVESGRDDCHAPLGFRHARHVRRRRRGRDPPRRAATRACCTSRTASRRAISRRARARSPTPPARARRRSISPSSIRASGTDRRALVLTSGDGRFLVGPDNGLLVAAAERCGGIAAAHALAVPAEAAPTFHGRDVFAPAAGRLALGEAPGALGAASMPGVLVRLHAVGRDASRSASLRAPCVHVDRFGNCALAAAAADLDGAGLVAGGAVAVAVRGHAARSRAARAHVRRRAAGRARRAGRLDGSPRRSASTAATPRRELRLAVGDDVELRLPID